VPEFYGWLSLTLTIGDVSQVSRYSMAAASLVIEESPGDCSR